MADASNDPEWWHSPNNIDVNRAIRKELAVFQKADTCRGLWQLSTTTFLLVALFAAMYAMPGKFVWVEPILALFAAGMVVRIFIIQHDCGHRSFLPSQRANDIVGVFCSLITMTPYANWRFQHAHHHAVWNNLSHRDDGTDIYSSCLTVAEYERLSRLRRRIYRIALHPVVALILLPPVIFLVLYRWPFDTPRKFRKERLSVWSTNLALIITYGGLALAFGLKSMLLVHLSTMLFASIVGVWLFSIQHRFESADWYRQGTWTAEQAALHGSSFLYMPRVLHWFTGNIAYHHLHHLAPRIPNYRLHHCQQFCENMLPSGNRITLWQALRAHRYTLWDERNERMAGFRDVHQRSRSS
jgi:omega-6 fatty acid desaturase (delta-12 desaturase)